MAADWNIEDLEVVGYANVLKETMLPSIVPPVFALKSDPNRAFLPPYSFNAGLLRNSTEVSESELKHLADAREITLFRVAFSGRAGFELWVDQKFGYHYEPREHANRTLRRIADEAIAAAEESLRNGEHEKAERLCGVAMSANDSRVEPFAIKAAIRRLDGKPGTDLMAELARPFIGQEGFNRQVEDYMRQSKTHPLPPASAARAHPPIWQMASQRAA